MLLDREREKGELDGLLASVRDGSSAALVLRGEPGVGKTALLEYTTASAGDMLVARVIGVESEIELGFAGLHQLLLPFLGGLERLPTPQREALGSAFGLVDSTPPDVFLVGLAALSLLADAPAERPVLCVIDDAQWVDQASAAVLGFVARRLFADSVGMIFVVREPASRSVAFEGVTELRVDGLPDTEAHELLASVAVGPLDRRVGDRLVSETRGNPLALIELGGELSAEELSGSLRLSEPLPLGSRLEERFLSRVRMLPANTQTLLLIAACEPSGEPELLWEAASRLGIGEEALALTGVEQLLTFTPRVAFRHPLIRSAVYHGATLLARRQAHETLAAVTDRERDTDRRAWHLAAAAVGPDEKVAGELERSAERARSRGGWASAAAFFELSAELTPDEGRRAERTLVAAQGALAAGAAQRSHELLGQASVSLTDPLLQARARRLEGQIRFGTGQLAETPAILLEAAGAFYPLDPLVARATLLEALEAANFAGSFASGASVGDVVRASREAPSTAGTRATTVDLLLDGFAARVELRHAEAMALFRRAIGALLGSQDLRWLGLGCFAASELLDDEARLAVANRWVKLARDQGALTSLPLALTFLGEAEVRAGRFGTADALHGEGREISAATGNPGMTGKANPPDLLVLAWRGRESDARSAAEAVRQDQTERRVGVGVSYVDVQMAVLENALGNYDAALACAFRITEDDPFYHGTQILPELVEAATRCGEQEAASRALDRLSERALASGASWALGLLARSRALLAEDTVAEALYRESIDRLGRCDTAPDTARAHLLYGEWLRRRRRRSDAREQLRRAHEMFDSIGAEAFAERARVDLLATGERARKRIPQTRDELTPREDRIARLASEGASNHEIAARLFISPNTVAYHLRHVFSKLGVSKRAQLAHRLNGSAESH